MPNASRLPLDPVGDHWLDASGTLHARDPLSPLAGALREHLQWDGAVASLGPVELGRFDPEQGWRMSTRSTPLELRYLADRGHPHPVGPLPRQTPRTDLHTHFAGCVGGEDLVRIGAETGVRYPAALLRLAGIAADADLPLAQASEPVRAQLARALGLPISAQCTHQDMNRVYALRSPLTKHRPAFAKLLAQIASDYAAMGVDYAELSLFDILDPAVLAVAEAELPRIREATGVDLRFLAALSRHDDLEWDLDMVRRLEAYAGSTVLVGVDFMGHETNSTRAFLPQIRAVAGFARAHRPDFVVRVHAGENPMFPENVRVAVEALLDAGVRARIGHGLYGVDDEVMERLIDGGVLVEFNLDSNFALNNVGDALQVPLARYAAAGAQVVLGTDGYGIYHGSSVDQARAAGLTGLTDLAGVHRTEARWIEQRHAHDADLARPFQVPVRAPEPLYYTDEVARRIAAEQAADAAALAAAVEQRGSTWIDALGEGSWVSFAGSWKHAWPRLPPADRQRIEAVIDDLVAGLARRGAHLLTGGTRYGVEGLVHAAARRHGAHVVGALVDATPPDDLDALAQVIRIGRTLYDKGPGLYAALAERGGAAVFFAGGNIVHDELRIASNLRLRRAVLAGVEGASGVAARRWPHLGFQTADEALALLDGNPAPTSAALWHPGANRCADVVCTREGPAGTEVLLVQRRVESATHGGRWALPGGFVIDEEPLRDTAVRVLAQETGLELAWLRDALQPLGVRARGGRDPRDTDERWTESHAFALRLPPNLAALTLVAGAGAGRTGWFTLTELPALAFDHAAIVAHSMTTSR